MQSLTLIDTSSWIEALRTSGNAEVRNRVKELLMGGKAAWCEMILLELWNGAQGESERKILKDFSMEIPMLPISSEVWTLAKRLAQTCRQKGKTVPSTDILIVSCGLMNKADIEHQDNHFDIILNLYSSILNQH